MPQDITRVIDTFIESNDLRSFLSLKPEDARKIAGNGPCKGRGKNRDSMRAMRRTIRRNMQPGFRDSCTEFHNDSGQSPVETALFLLLPMLLAVFAVDFGYFFIVAANLISSARNAVKYSIRGVESPGQSSLAAAEPLTSADSVSALTVGDRSGLTDSSTATTVEACSKVFGAAQNTTQCNSYGPAIASHTPGIDPEAPTFLLSRVDGTYTVHPPIPISFVSYSLMPSLPFYRQVSMRVVD